MQNGILPMGRAASMFSSFYHLDENCRNVVMQRSKPTEWDCIIVVAPELLVKFVPLEHIFINPIGT
eukprot:68954-Lingulodinium_polyedra.AAC.1